MKAFALAIVIGGAILHSLAGLAQTGATMTARPSGFDRLGSLVGRWTIKGSGGRNETMSGTFADGVLEFTAEEIENGTPLISRVRMGPFSDREVPFVAESSTDRVKRTVDASFTYVRLGEP